MTIPSPNSDPFQQKAALLGGMLELAVPLWIARIEDQGGPNEEDMTFARESGNIIAERADRLMFRDKETVDLFNRLARALAILAFCPGGVRFLDRTWVAGTQPQPQPQDPKDQ